MTSTLETRKLRAGVTSKAPMESRGIPFVGTEIRSVPDGTGSTKLRLTGHASLTEAPYTQTDSQGTCTETVARGAFARHQLPCKHEGVSLARTKSGSLTLSEDATGMHVGARIDLKRPDVQILRSAIDNGDL